MNYRPIIISKKLFAQRVDDGKIFAVDESTYSVTLDKKGKVQHIEINTDQGNIVSKCIFKGELNNEILTITEVVFNGSTWGSWKINPQPVS